MNSYECIMFPMLPRGLWEKKKKYINKDSIPVYVQFTAGLEQLNMEIIFGLFGIFQSGTMVEDPRVNNA